MSRGVDRGPVRAFIAIELPSQVQQLLGRHITSLKARLPVPMRWLCPQAIHLTLKFLGDIHQGQVSETMRALRVVSRGIAPFQLRTGPLGCFPNTRRPQVLWVWLTGELETLGTLQQRLEDAMVYLGFAKEDRPFVPHLTLARAKGMRPRLGRMLLEEVLAEGHRKEETFNVEGLSLMKSTPTSKGAVHRRLDLVMLGNYGRDIGMASP